MRSSLHMRFILFIMPFVRLLIDAFVLFILTEL